MSDKVFFDSNIWLCALIKSRADADVKKHTLAKHWVSSQQNIHSSTQVVNEICFNLMRKANKDHEYIYQFTRDFCTAYEVHSQSQNDLLTASTLRLEHCFSYWDSLIVASALNSGCEVLYSEDMQQGLIVYGKLTIVNPLI